MLAPRVLIGAVLPRHARARLGPDRQRRLELDPRADPRPGALELPPPRRWSGFLKTLRARSPRDGVTVNDVATGRFATDRLAANWGGWEEMERGAAEGVPAGRLGEPAEYGDLVAFLCSERAAYVTGTSIPIDGGLLRSI